VTARINISKMACNLSTIINSQLTLSAQVSVMCHNGYYQLQHLMLSRCWSRHTFHGTWTTVTHFSTTSLMSRLQSVQNAAVRLVYGTRCCNHITLVLQKLHWLPVQHRVDFEIATLVYLSLSSTAPSYLAADCQLVSDEGHCQLRSANSRTCVVRRTCSSYGDRCFAAAGPTL